MREETRDKLILTIFWILFIAFPFVMLFYGDYIVGFLFSILEWVIALVCLIIIGLKFLVMFGRAPALLLLILYSINEKIKETKRK